MSDERRNFRSADFQPLQIHYDEKTVQIHITQRYAERGLESMADALQLVVDYFFMSQDEFLEKWLSGSRAQLKRQSTAGSWRRIVDRLGNTQQRRVVIDDRETVNTLVLAGPGSGKTMVLVHRVGYLLRIRRERPQSILVLAYNRHAAVEIRQRLRALVGDDARGVTVMTCHALAMRLTGDSFAGRARQVTEADFADCLRRATSLLRGDGLLPDEADELRERLMGGFRWILVDEYHDAGRLEYGLITALAARARGNEEERRVSLLAVGDDDQNIYSFRGASVEYVRRFEEEYEAERVMLTSNYRSTGHIIGASNVLMEGVPDRMKAEVPIEIDAGRESHPDGGEWTFDLVTYGRVQVLDVPDSDGAQAVAVVAEMSRMAALDGGWDWSRCAVVAREWRFLEPVRAVCEKMGIPSEMAREDFTAIWFLREMEALRDWLEARRGGFVTAGEMQEFVEGMVASRWVELVKGALDEYVDDAGEGERGVDFVIEWLAEWARSVREKPGGVLLLTAHRAKGLEFDHVYILDGAWERVSRNEDADASRRLYYVAMTRAMKTLALFRWSVRNPFLGALSKVSAVFERDAYAGIEGDEESGLVYRRLSLGDVFLSWAGYKDARQPVHQWLAALREGDHLTVRQQGRGRSYALCDSRGREVGRLARRFEVPRGKRVKSASVLAVVVWRKDLSEYQEQRQSLLDRWEVVLPEIVFE